MAPLGRLAPLRSAALAAVLALAGVPGTGSLRAQEQAPADTAAADTAGVDTLPAGDTVPGAPTDTTEAEAPPPSFPSGLTPTDSVAAGDVRTWTREELLASSALSLLDFLLDEAPGVLPLRAGFYVGPHHLTDGLLGPGAVRVVVDGRELPPLESGQPDLARVPLSHVERLRLVRRAGETVIHVTSASHPGGEAYSRVTGGTGQPSADLIRGVFTNGAGDHFTVAGSIDYITVGAGSMPGNRLDAWGKLSWMPFGNRSGVEVLWRNDAVDRAGGQADGEFERRDLLLHVRSRIDDGLQLDAWAGQSTRQPAPRPALDDGAPLPGGGEDPEELPALNVEHADIGVTYLGRLLSGQANLRVRSAPGLEEIALEGRAAVRIAPSLLLDAGADMASWREFATSSVSGGLTFRPELPGEPRVRLDASTGTHGVARPGRSADSLSSDALAGSVELRVGPYRVAERVTHRSHRRQLPFGGTFDAALVPLGGATVTAFETQVRGPVLPVDPIQDRFRFRWVWRHSRVEGQALPLYLPVDFARTEVVANDFFFDRNLEVTAKAQFVYRSPMRTAAPGEPTPVTLETEMAWNTSVVIRIDTFRLWWRVDNVRRTEQADFGGLVFPLQRNVFGIRWEFFN